MSEGDKATCRRNCWLTGLAGGLLLWAGLVLMAGYPAGQALILAVIVGGVLGLFLVWAFCTGPVSVATTSTAPAAVPPAAAPPAPAPVAAQPVSQPAPPVQPAPVVAPAPEPVPAPPRPVAEVTPRPDPSKVAPAPVVAPQEPAKPARAPRKAAAKSEPAAKPAPAAATAPKAAAKPKVAPAPKAPASPRATGLDAAMGRTKEAAPAEAGLLIQPRGGKGDDLKLIVGVGPALEKLLNGIGVWHFDQIAAWKAKDIALVDSKMANFKGRISRDGWVKQARALAKGETPKAGGRK